MDLRAGVQLSVVTEKLNVVTDGDRRKLGQGFTSTPIMMSYRIREHPRGTLRLRLTAGLHIPTQDRTHTLIP